MRTLFFTTLFLIAACTKAEPAPESAACCTNEATTHEHRTEPSSATGATTDPVSLDGIKVLGTWTRDGIVVSVQNHSDHTVSLASQLGIARGLNVGLHVPGGGPVLRWSCDVPVAPCVTLAPGAELIPPMWPGRKGKGTCGECPQCVDLEPDSYFFSATSCAQNAEVLGTPFLVESSR